MQIVVVDHADVISMQVNFKVYIFFYLFGDNFWYKWQFMRGCRTGRIWRLCLSNLIICHQKNMEPMWCELGHGSSVSLNTFMFSCSRYDNINSVLWTVSCHGNLLFIICIFSQTMSILVKLVHWCSRYLDQHAQYYRQTILLSSYLTPGMDWAPPSFFFSNVERTEMLKATNYAWELHWLVNRLII